MVVISFSQHACSPQKGVGDNIINDSFLMLCSNSTCKLRIHVTDLNYLSGDSVSAKGISVNFFLGLSSSWKPPSVSNYFEAWNPYSLIKLNCDLQLGKCRQILILWSFEVHVTAPEIATMFSLGTQWPIKALIVIKLANSIENMKIWRQLDILICRPIFRGLFWSLDMSRKQQYPCQSSHVVKPVIMCSYEISPFVTLLQFKVFLTRLTIKYRLLWSR